MNGSQVSDDGLPDLAEAQEKIGRLKASIEKIIIGKSDVIERTVTALLARGHLLIEDVPGVGKTTLAHALARSIDGGFQRIQFTNDLLPSDVLGVSIYSPATEEFRFEPGPIFANIVLADEINRTSPKTQSCLLEAMNDGQVSIDGQTLRLPTPFMVLATQNSMEFTGTFPLPESQLDRFLMRLRMGYPSSEDERRLLLGKNPAEAIPALEPVISTSDVDGLQQIVGRIRISPVVTDYVLALVERSRADERLALGVSPRGAMALMRAAQALALIRGRGYVLPDDLKELAVQVFAHRVVLSNRVVSTGHDRDLQETIILEALERVEVPI